MSADRSRRRPTYRLVAGAIGGTIGLALALLVVYLADQAPWTLITSMTLPGVCTFAAVLAGDRIWLRREYGKDPS